jgi:hypothetical protein
LKGLAGACSWVSGRKGITPDLNGVYFVPVLQNNGTSVLVQSRPEAGKKDIGVSKVSWVEPDLLYPLIKGAGDFEACYLKLENPAYTTPLLYTFVPNKGINRQDYAKADADINSPALSQTRAWFQGFKVLLEARSTFRRQMEPTGAAYHAIYNVGDYTFEPWKVIWPEMSTHFYAAVASAANVPLVGNRPYVPDHKVYFVSFRKKEPAYFLCGLLNAPMAREWIESHTVSIQIGNVFKHMNLPEFDSQQSAHTSLSFLVEAAHGEHNAVLRAILVKQIETQADQVLTNWLTAMSNP